MRPLKIANVIKRWIENVGEIFSVVYIKGSSFSLFRATPVLGFLPQELLGTSMYEYYHHDDIPHLAESHKAVLQTSERVTTQVIS